MVTRAFCKCADRCPCQVLVQRALIQVASNAHCTYFAHGCCAPTKGGFMARFLFFCVLSLASALSQATGAPRALLPHEQQLLASAAAPSGARVLITLRTAVDTSTHHPINEC